MFNWVMIFMLRVQQVSCSTRSFSEDMGGGDDSNSLVFQAGKGMWKLVLLADKD